MAEEVIHKGFIKHESSGLFVIPANGKGFKGAFLVLSELNDNNQGCMFEYQSAGYIKHIESGCYIHPQNGKKNPANGTKLLLHPDKHFRMQFTVLNNGNIVHSSSEKYWNIDGNAFENGSHIVLREDNKFCNFKFIAMEINDDEDSWDNVTHGNNNNNNDNNNDINDEDIKDDNIPDEYTNGEINNDITDDIHDDAPGAAIENNKMGYGSTKKNTRKVIPPGAYFIFAQNSGYCMDVLYSKKDDRTPVIQWKLNGGTLYICFHLIKYIQYTHKYNISIYRCLSTILFPL